MRVPKSNYYSRVLPPVDDVVGVVAVAPDHQRAHLIDIKNTVNIVCFFKQIKFYLCVQRDLPKVLLALCFDCQTLRVIDEAVRTDADELRAKSM